MIFHQLAREQLRERRAKLRLPLHVCANPPVLNRSLWSFAQAVEG